MKWINSLRPLSIRQRIVLWIGGVVLLLTILYPQFQTSYYAWAGDNGWVVFYQQDRRMFITDGESFGMPNDIKRQGLGSYPEIPGRFDRETWSGVYVDKRDSVKIANLLVQTLATAAVTLGLAWALKRDS